MRLKWAAFSFVLGLIVMLDPTHTPAQPGGGKGGFGKGGFGKGGFGGDPGGGFGGGKGGFGGGREGGFGKGGFGGDPGSGFGGGKGGFGKGGFGGDSGGGFNQPGGGFGGGGRTQDPERTWGMLHQSAGAGPDAIDLGKLPGWSRNMSRGLAEKYGAEPLPESGVMTKAQFLDFSARNAAKIAAATENAGGRPMGDSRGGPPMSDSRDSRGGPPMGGGEDRGADRLRQQDKNGDGRISEAEADRMLQPNFKKIDRDGDGYITLDEYRGWYANQQNDRNRGGDNRDNRDNGYDPNNPDGRDRRNRDDRKEVEEPKPVALRYGHLPKDLPEWYDTCDGDQDGQVALHEWRRAGKSMAEFGEMDLNGDGFVTADELLRFNRQRVEAERIAAIMDGTSLGNRPAVAGNRGPGGPRAGKGEDRADRGADAEGSEKNAASDRPPSGKGEKGSGGPRPEGGGGPKGKGRQQPEKQ